MQTSPDRHDLQLALGERINALLSATRSLSERSAAHFHPQLQPAAFHIARWLYAYGPAKPSVIAEAVGMDRSSTSTLIGKMRTLGLLAAEQSPGDRRSITVELTPDGRTRVAATMGERGKEFYARTEDWSTDDLAQLVALLGRLTAEP
ncbi:MarR family winged helix-turn-helix transcriptional regulator [Actinoplanes sp. L3-i22]|uniref:MarR family winged helix-turn-helix transcriptional regulator n=1 Tax=Actinoplanes sp. L3-i22 TaxID=2836373 RepID=UPI001C855797|nr:MarR family winged helix-turn-helix transcriptional regulator [Actinoplanes sp. L3-i22]